MKLSSAILGLSLCGVAVLAAGCTAMRTYGGASRPAGEVATIRYHRYPWDVLFHDLHVVAVDGKHTSGWTQELTARFELLPGRHELELQWAGAVKLAPERCRIELEAEAGHDYRFDSERSLHTWQAWLVDQGTGERFTCVAAPPVA